MVKTKIETRTGWCATHGEVQATREIPGIRFPALYSVPKHLIAHWRRPFTCPQCGSKVTLSQSKVTVS